MKRWRITASVVGSKYIGVVKAGAFKPPDYELPPSHAEPGEHKTLADLGAIYLKDVDPEWARMMDMCGRAGYPCHRITIEYNRYQPWSRSESACEQPHREDTP